MKIEEVTQKIREIDQKNYGTAAKEQQKIIGKAFREVVKDNDTQTMDEIWQIAREIEDQEKIYSRSVEYLESANMGFSPILLKSREMLINDPSLASDIPAEAAVKLNQYRQEVAKENEKDTFWQNKIHDSGKATLGMQR